MFSFRPGSEGVYVEGCSDVAIADCVIWGGDGGGEPHGFDDTCDGGDGAAAVRVINSVVLMQDCKLWGGDGGHCGNSGGLGGDGVDVVFGSLTLENCQGVGGEGGGGCFSFTIGGTGGHGLQLQDAAEGSTLGNLLIGGDGGHVSNPYPPGSRGHPGEPTFGPGVLTVHPGKSRRLDWSPLCPSGSSQPVKVKGNPGDRVYWGFGRTMTPRSLPGVRGTWTLPGPLIGAPQFLGVIPPDSDTLITSIKIPDLPMFVPGLTLFGQGYVEDTSGAPILGSARPFLVLLPDGPMVPGGASMRRSACPFREQAEA